MSFALTFTRARTGLQAPQVTVETHLSNGLPKFTIVGLPEKTVRESRDRVKSAIINCQFKFPSKQITVNLAPANLPKEGSHYDLAIALSILAASGLIPSGPLAKYEFVSELGLSGELRPCSAIITIACGSREVPMPLIIPEQNAAEASITKQKEIYVAKHLLDIVNHITGRQPLKKTQGIVLPEVTRSHGQDLSDIRGQSEGCRALTIAAAGRHSLLLVGPPGTGKTLLASRLASILPPLTDEEAIEVASIASIKGKFAMDQWRRHPYRAPHHTASSVALVGGGSTPKPGEITLAHHGVLFLDELPEFNRQVLEALREPLESGHVTISRAAQQMDYPAKFQLIAAMNPCPCGYHGQTHILCRCTPEQIQRYQSKLSGPFLDRIDLSIYVRYQSPEDLILKRLPPAPTSQSVRQSVIKAREIQLTRSGKPNADLQQNELSRVTELNRQDERWLATAMTQLNLSTRVYHRILRISRTIADLAGEANISKDHLLEALSYRQF